MLNFGFRNLFLFLKDKISIFLSFLAELIIVGLYILFIRDNLIESFPRLSNAGLLMDVWMISGLLGVTSVTTTMGAYGILVEDKSKKIDRDFQTSPIRTDSLQGGYIISAVFIGLFVPFLLLILSEIYIFSCSANIFSYRAVFSSSLVIGFTSILIQKKPTDFQSRKPIGYVLICI